jgi:hypothetical protein
MLLADLNARMSDTGSGDPPEEWREIKIIRFLLICVWALAPASLHSQKSGGCSAVADER